MIKSAKNFLGSFNSPQGAAAPKNDFSDDEDATAIAGKGSVSSSSKVKLNCVHNETPWQNIYFSHEMESFFKSF